MGFVEETRYRSGLLHIDARLVASMATAVVLISRRRYLCLVVIVCETQKAPLVSSLNDDSSSGYIAAAARLEVTSKADS